MTAPAFTPEQARAIDDRRGSLLLAAGAGSGKTSVLVERLVRAVRDDGVPLSEVLAITFTEKAAGELRTRVQERFAQLGDGARAREAQSRWNVSATACGLVTTIASHPCGSPPVTRTRAATGSPSPTSPSAVAP